MSNITPYQGGAPATYTGETSSSPFVNDSGSVDTTWSGEDEATLHSLGRYLRAEGMETDKVLPAIKAWIERSASTEVFEQRANDQKHIREGLKVLRHAWGPDYRGNMQILDGLLDDLDESASVAILSSRDEGGKLLLNNASVAQFLVRAARSLAADRMGSNHRRTSTDETELEQIHKMMGDRNSPYWKGERAERLQARYRELLGGDDDE